MPMRIERIELEWFRGAGPPVELDTNGKSVAVYGPNGAGKSSFADALEYVLNDKVHHLAHEYSGTHQVKGTRNTHAPPDARSRISIGFAGGRELTIEIEQNGSSTLSTEDETLYQLLRSWGTGRVLLRQDEVAEFIHASKSQKYSALLPLLGLDELEIAAENIRKLAKGVCDLGGVDELEERVSRLAQDLEGAFGSTDEASVRSSLEPLLQRYFDGVDTNGLEAQLAALSAEIQTRLSFHERDIRLARIKRFALGEVCDRWKADQRTADSLVDDLLDRRIAVLEPTGAYIQALECEEDETDCPACGRRIARGELESHVLEELEALEDARAARQAAKDSATSLERTLQAILDELSAQEVEDWPDRPEHSELRKALEKLHEGLQPGSSPPWGVGEELAVLIDQLEDLPDSPPTATELMEDQNVVSKARSFLELSELRARLDRLALVVEALEFAEASLRQAIHDRTSEILEEISEEIQRLWSKLHPGEPIEGVHLYAPPDRNKAVDVALSFFGVEQPSPRLALSEGHRNSLGLAIFLAIARRSGETPLPIVLDDVVSSMDREHRGFVAEVLKDDLGDRQVILLTHDREWFGELRRRLDQGSWVFRVLRPFDDPARGLRWLDGHGDKLEEARSLLDEYPEAAANRARAFMDSELALLAHKLELPMPYRRGDANDQRTCNDFLPKLLKEAGSKLKAKQGEVWSLVDLASLETAAELLAAWANRGSHSGTVTRNEADRLIETCESAIARFRCTECRCDVWRTRHTSSGHFQCSCGQLRWKG
jgi:energy-coupling factor transporter ATP-binding protein EcfA2